MRGLTEQDIGADAVAALNKDCIDVLMMSLRYMKKHHNVSMPSGHLLFISRLIGFVQSIDPVSTDAMLRAFTAIHGAAGDPIKLEKANADLAAAQDKLLLGFDLFYARPENGGHA